MLKFWHKNFELILKNKLQQRVNIPNRFGILLSNLTNFHFKVKYLLVKHLSVCWLLLMLLRLDFVLGHGLLFVFLFLVLWFLSHLWFLLEHPFFFLFLDLFLSTSPILHYPHHYSHNYACNWTFLLPVKDSDKLLCYFILWCKERSKQGIINEMKC